MIDVTIYSVMPFIVGIGFIMMGILYLLIPAPSAVKLDRGLEQWVHSSPNPHIRARLVSRAVRCFGAFVCIGGLLYTLVSLVRYGVL